jgi:hypothetical protein
MCWKHTEVLKFESCIACYLIPAAFLKIGAKSCLTLNAIYMKLKLSSDRWSVGQSVTVSGTHPEPMTIFLFPDNYRFLGGGRPLWREDVSVIWALPEQSVLGPSPAELMTISHCLIWDSHCISDDMTLHNHRCEDLKPVYLNAGWPRSISGLEIFPRQI